MLRVLGVIPARGGSKGMPGKNLAPLAGRPLIAHTCDTALQSARLTERIVSTDSAEIAAAARACGVSALDRPAALAGDDTPMIDVVRHVLASIGAQGGPIDAVVLLQPTSPLRRAEHIDRAVDMLIETGADTVVSVVEVPHHFTPGSLMQEESGRLRPLVPGKPLLQRQRKPRLYARNGPAVLAVRTQAIQEGGFYDGDVRAMVMTPEDSIDIDGPTDLRLAEFWLADRAAARGGSGS